MAQTLDGDLAPAAVLSRFGLLAEDGWQAQHLRTMNNSVFSIGRSVEEPAWALRRHRADWRDADAIGAELALLEYLDEQLPDPFSVPRPGRSRDGDYLVTLDGARYSLLGWIPGMPQRPHPVGGLDAESAWLLGRGLGSIHSVTDRWTRRTAPMQWNARTLFTEAHPGLLGADPAALRAILPAADLELFDEVADRTSEVFDRVQDWGLIHADYILGNCHWTTVEGRLSLGILDFDDFGHGPRLFDLGAVLGNLADFPRTWATLAPAFLAGYRTAHDLPENAEQELPLMMAARHTSHCLWALGHQDLGQEWIITHLHDRMELARLCLAVSFDFRSV
ncbi:phosphotransferase enzyme family protein [Kribbella sp. CA-294648]|uniref:phosphotransferase enzyme family protein n=1 Tax=Kribbella sp. CA-294648 TaxID=3239948 RepID=UPI003D92C604